MEKKDPCRAQVTAVGENLALPTTPDPHIIKQTELYSNAIKIQLNTQ